MIHILMAISILALIVSTVHTFIQYRRGKVIPKIFIKMLAITLLFIILMIFMLIAEFVIFAA